MCSLPCRVSLSSPVHLEFHILLMGDLGGGHRFESCLCFLRLCGIPEFLNISLTNKVGTAFQDGQWLVAEDAS